MQSPAEDIKDMLEAESSLGLIFANNLFTNKEPGSPIECVTIFDTGGLSPSLGLTTQGYEYPSVNIRVRGINYIDTWNLANDIKDSLHGRAQETRNGTLYSVIYCSNGPYLLDWDDNGNCRIVLNFNINRR